MKDTSAICGICKQIRPTSAAALACYDGHNHRAILKRAREERNEYPLHVPMHSAATLERAAQLCGGLTLS
jgi:hypothetical protein